MTTTLIRPGPTDAPSPERDAGLDVVAALLLLQGSMTLLTVLVAGLSQAAIPAVLTGLGAVGLLIGSARLRAGSRRARRPIMVLEISLLVWAAVDFALAAFLTGNPLEMVPVLTRIVLPVTVFVMLRRRKNLGTGAAA